MIRHHRQRAQKTRLLVAAWALLPIPLPAGEPTRFSNIARRDNTASNRTKAAGTAGDWTRAIGEAPDECRGSAPIARVDEEKSVHVGFCVHFVVASGFRRVNVGGQENRGAYQR